MLVNYTCGHSENVRVTSKEEARQLRENPGICRDCRKIEIAAQPRKADLTLPPLKGSAKQIAWAEQIRAKVVEHRGNIVPLVEQEAAESEKAHMVGYIANTLDRFIEDTTDAAAWIDAFKTITRTDSPAIAIIGGMAQRPELFDLDVADSNFLYNVGRYAK